MNYFLHSFDTTNLVEFADTILEDDYGVMFETRIVNALNKILSIINPTIIYSKLTLQELKDKIASSSSSVAIDDGKTNTLEMTNLNQNMDNMDRNFSSQSTESFRNLVDEKDRTRKGHKICFGYCYITFSMISFAIIMAVIVGIGGWNIWQIGHKPMKPTIEDILMFTEKMIAVETEYIVERALYSTKQFIDFTKVIPTITQVENDNILFDKFLDDDLIASPRFDGIIQLQFNQTLSTIQSSFIFKKSNNERVDYICYLNKPQDCDKPDLWNISNKMWQNRQNGINNNGHTDSYFISNSIIDNNDNSGSIWFITWRYVTQNEIKILGQNSFIIGGMFRSSRINAEYKNLTLAKDGIVYWITNDKYGDVFVTSLNNEILYIKSHDKENSSINLDSSFALTQTENYYKEKKNKIDLRIIDTMNNIDIEKNNNSIENEKYYIYYELIEEKYESSSSSSSSFGSFYVVIAFPIDKVFYELNFGMYLVIGFTSLAVLCAIINACIANAVPLIPNDDSWLATPLFTEQDKKELNDNMEIGRKMKEIHEMNSKERLNNHFKQRRQNIEIQKPPPMPLAKTKKVLSGLNVFENDKNKISPYKPMIVQTMDIPLAPIANSHRNSSNGNIMIKSSISTTIMTEENFDIDQKQKDIKQEFNRQRSNSDEIFEKKKNSLKKKAIDKQIENKQDAIKRIQALSNEMVMNEQMTKNEQITTSVPLKKAKTDLPHANTDLIPKRKGSSNIRDDGGNVILSAYNNDTSDFEINSDDDFDNFDDDDDDDDNPMPMPPKRALSHGAGLKESNRFHQRAQRKETEKKKKTRN